MNQEPSWYLGREQLLPGNKCKALNTTNRGIYKRINPLIMIIVIGKERIEAGSEGSRQRRRGESK